MEVHATWVAAVVLEFAGDIFWMGEQTIWFVSADLLVSARALRLRMVKSTVSSISTESILPEETVVGLMS